MSEVLILTRDMLGKIPLLDTGRGRICTHQPEDVLQDMFIRLGPTDVGVHRHKADESIEVIEGRVEVTYYTENRQVSTWLLMDPERVFYVRIPAGIWHSVKVPENAIVHEVTTGPYLKENTEWT